jgi:hypothetical protein
VKAVGAEVYCGERVVSRHARIVPEKEVGSTFER